MGSGGSRLGAARAGILVVCADTAAVRARYGISNVVGNFSGRLDGSGERIVLANHAGVIVQSVRYRDRGKWPAEPDGTPRSRPNRTAAPPGYRTNPSHL